MAVKFTLADKRAWDKEIQSNKSSNRLRMTPEDKADWDKELAGTSMQPVQHQSQQASPLPFPMTPSIPPGTFSNLQKIPFVHNLEGGVVNDLANIGNLFLTGGQKLSQMATGHPQAINQSLIPKIKADEHSWPYIIGEGGSFFLPFGVAAKGIEGLGALARAGKIATRLAESERPALASLARLGGQVGTSAGAGAAAGAVTSDPGTRGMGALAGGAGGGLGELAGQALGFAGRHLRDTGAISKLKEHAKKVLDVAQTPGERLIKTIGNAYIRARNQTSPAYRKIFSTLKDKKAGMEAREFENYSAELAKDKKRNVQPPTEAMYPEDLTTDELKKDVSITPYTGYQENLANPNEVHKLQSTLRTKGYSTDNDQYKRYGEALKKDLINFMEKYELKDEYEKATEAFKKDVAPFLKNKHIKKNVIPKVESEIEHMEGLPKSDQDDMEAFDNEGRYKRKFTGIEDVAGDSHNIAKKLVPSAGEGDMHKLDYLEEILGHLPNNEAMHHARDMIFAHTLRYEPRHGISLPDINAAVARYQRMSPDQVKKLFTPEEEKVMDSLEHIKKTMPNRNWLADAATRLAGGALGHHLLGLPGGFIGYAAAPEVGRTIADIASELGTRDPERLMKRLTRLGGVPRTQLSGPLASSLLHLFQQKRGN